MPWKHLETELAAAGIPVRRNEPLRDYTTFALGGPCPLLADCATAEQLTAACRVLRAAGTVPILIGGGSNLLVADGGVDRPVLRYASPTPDIAWDGELLCVCGATGLDDLAAFAAANGLAGPTNCSGIPGTVGGALAGNAGAFGWQLGDALAKVAVLTPAGRRQVLAAADIRFSYRHSSLRDDGLAVLTVWLQAAPGDATATLAERERILDLRRQKHPDYHRDPCAGSFFRNIEPTSAAARRQAAGAFLEEAGAKAMRVGGAGVFPKHANIVIKIAPECTAADVHELSCRMAEAVRRRFGIDLVREVQLLGEFA